VNNFHLSFCLPHSFTCAISSLSSMFQLLFQPNACLIASSSWNGQHTDITQWPDIKIGYWACHFHSTQLPTCRPSSQLNLLNQPTITVKILLKLWTVFFIMCIRLNSWQTGICLRALWHHSILFSFSLWMICICIPTYKEKRRHSCRCSAAFRESYYKYV